MQAHGADGARRRGRIPLSRAVRGAVVLEAAAGAFLGGRDGTTVWQLTRVLFVVACATAALYGVQRRTGWGRGLVALTLGAIGWAVGLGVGATHLVKVGRSPVTVAGLACLVAGVVLLVAGVVNVTRAARGWRRPLAGLTAVLVIFLVVQPLAPALYATNVPPTSLGVLTPADRGLAYRDVALRTPDGVTLSGWYVPSRNGAAVVLLHGAGSTRSAMLRYAVVLARHGYGVLLYDARGHGRSGGRAMDLGWYGDQDLAGAVSFLQT
ncbi:MAG: alpha/beta hydrolase, partial [Nocardioidaceae bacterium]